MATNKPSKAGAPSKSKSDKIEDGLKAQQKEQYELVRLRNNFYRDSYRRLTFIMILMLMVVLMCLSVVFYLVNHQPKPKYFATNIYGGIVPIQGLDQPIPEQQVVQWASRAAARALTFNYVQYRGQLQEAVNVYFTPFGGKMYLQALNDSLNIQNVTKNKYLQVAEPLAAPRIIQKGTDANNGQARYYWKVQVPVQVNFYGAQGVNSFYEIVELKIVRSSYFVENSQKSQLVSSNNLDQTRGIGVDQIVLNPVSYQDAIRNKGLTT